MKVIRFNAAETYEPEKDWKRVSLCAEEDISIEHFVKPALHASPRHEHPNSQVLVVLEGEITVTTDAETLHVKKDDAIYIEGNIPHVVTNPLEAPATGLDIFVPGRSFDFWRKRKAAEGK